MAGKLFAACEWIARMAYLNLIWLLFTAAGLVLFGFMPATAAMFAIIRKWLMKEADIPVWSTFLAVYRQEFRKSNTLGLFLAGGGALLYLDARFLLDVDGAIRFTAGAVLLAILCVYLLLLLFLFPVYAHYELRPLQYMKQAVLLGIVNLPIALGMLVGLSAAVFLLLYIPALIPFFGPVSVGCILMSGGMYSINRVHGRESVAAE